MFRVRKAGLLLLRLLLAFVVMLVAYIMGTMVIGQANTAMTPEEAGQAGQALLLVSLFSALVLSFLIMRSGWHGLKLIGAVIVVHFGAVLLSILLALFPNPYMPAAVRQTHFFELLSSMLVFGGTAGWVLHNSERVEGATRRSAPAPQS